MTSVLLG